MATASDYAQTLAQLLPPGQAFSQEPGSIYGQLLNGVAEELARIDARGGQLIEEAFPDTTNEMFSSWLAMVGVPDVCSDVAVTVTDERAQLIQKLTAQSGQTPAFYVLLAASLGYTARVLEFKEFVAGSYAGDPLYDVSWRHAFSLVVSGGANQARAGLTRAGARIRDFAADLLYCVLQRSKPAQTVAFVGFE